MTAVVRKVTFAEVRRNENFPALLREYAEEAANRDLPAPDEKLAAYPLIEESGALHIFGAFVGDELVGFFALLLTVIPHYGVAIGVGESFFVARGHRNFGTGNKLLRAAEVWAEQAGSPALMVSAPTGGRLERVLPLLGYRETNRVFLRKLPCTI